MAEEKRYRLMEQEPEEKKQEEDGDCKSLASMAETRID